MNVDVRDKIIVITGASKGIGSEIAKVFSREGAIVVMNYCHSRELAERNYAEVIKYSPDSILIKADITKADEVSKMYQEVMRRWGQIDILINNAGICDDSLIQMMAVEKWKSVLDVNLTGMFLCSREFSKAMIKQKRGKIINIASIKGQEGSAGQVNYSASKAGVIGFTKALAKELGQYNISVNAICPGFIITDLNRHDDNKKSVAETRSILSYTEALNDLLNFIVLIASNRMSGVSGRNFNLDSRIL